MSTNSAPTSTTVKRRAKDGSVSKISCSENVHSYNRFMGRVDLADQLRGYYHVRLKCRKFYKFCLCLWLLFGSTLQSVFLFNCCTVNAFILQRYFKPRNNCGSRQILKSFHICLAQRLIRGYNCSQKYSLPTPIYNVAHHQSTPPAKRRRMNDTNTTPSDLGHFPIKGERGRSYCWNIKHRQHESTMQEMRDLLVCPA